MAALQDGISFYMNWLQFLRSGLEGLVDFLAKPPVGAKSHRS